MQEFIIHSPDFEAAKFWVGNMGKTATHAVVFAQLYMPGGQCHGLHPFIVQVGRAGDAVADAVLATGRPCVDEDALSILQHRGVPEKGPCTPRAGRR